MQIFLSEPDWLSQQDRRWLTHLYNFTGILNALTYNRIGRFAHEAAEELALEAHQPGTCIKWWNGFCADGQACFYEHRDTGFDGLYQTGKVSRQRL